MFAWWVRARRERQRVERMGSGQRKYVLAIDQGTTSSRFIVFDGRGAVVAVAQREHAQIYPQPGWVAHDATEIWRNTEAVIGEALERGGFERRAEEMALPFVAADREQAPQLPLGLHALGGHLWQSLEGGSDESDDQWASP